MDSSKHFTEFLNHRIQLPTIRKFYRSQLFEMAMMNKAYGRMLVQCGLLEREQYAVISGGLDRVCANLKESDLDGDKEDFYFNFYDALCREIGEETACLIHVGRSRNDICCTTNRMEIRRSIWEAVQALIDLQETLLEKAAQNRAVPFVYYTFGQPAQPGTLGHYFAMQARVFARDFERLKAAYQNVNQCPMGAAAGIGTSYPLDRTLVSELLGFDGVLLHTMDAISSFDYIVQVQMSLSLFMANISRMTTDLLFWTSEESHLLECDRCITSGSSIMPQKKNSVAMDYTRARSCHAAGTLNEMLMLYQKSASFPSLEHLELFFNYWESLDTSLAAAGELRDVLLHTRPCPDRIQDLSDRSLVTAASFAEYLAVKLQIPFTQTHDIVGEMVRSLAENGRLNCRNMTGACLAEASQRVLGHRISLPEEEIQRVLSHGACLEHLATEGSPKASELESLLQTEKIRLGEEKAWLSQCRARVEHAYQRILAEEPT